MTLTLLLLGGSRTGLGLDKPSCLAGEYGECGGSLAWPRRADIPMCGRLGAGTTGIDSAVIGVELITEVLAGEFAGVTKC